MSHQDEEERAQSHGMVFAAMKRHYQLELRHSPFLAAVICPHSSKLGEVPIVGLRGQSLSHFLVSQDECR